jgi:hypothetical protein
MLKIIIILSFISFPLLTEEKKPRYTYHTIILPNGKSYTYGIDHSPEAKAKIDAQFGPLQGYPTVYYGSNK